MAFSRRSLLLICAAVLTLWPVTSNARERIIVFAAASLKTALDEIAGGWGEHHDADVSVSYAGSSMLARQIERGAAPDLFISANLDWMDDLERQGLLIDGTRHALLGNRLVLIAHGSQAPEIALDALASRVDDDGGRLAMALVDAVPAGIYGKAALENLGLWEAIRDHVAQTDNVRAALALVARGEAPFGIVYASDARAQEDISVIATFPDESHPPIVYPIAMIAGSATPHARALYDHLTASPEARATFEAQGFSMIE